MKGPGQEKVYFNIDTPSYLIPVTINSFAKITLIEFMGDYSTEKKV
jgi:hypothetical protein